MTSRPIDLPDFKSPPVTEVSLGVQFNTLDRLLAPHFGSIWSAFRTEFPNTEEHPPLEPVFETFGEPGGGMPLARLSLKVFSTPPTPRVFFINESKTELLQLQRDRFHHNWRKVGDGDEYPRFERMLETFETGLQKLQKVIETEGLGSIEPNQAEVTYINSIPVPAGQTSFGVFKDLFESYASSATLKNLREPEDARFLLRYVIRDPSSGAPVGRVIVTAEPAWKLDGSTILQLTLVARGKPIGEGRSGVRRFLEVGREHIVRAFTELTTGKMHSKWGRTL